MKHKLLIFAFLAFLSAGCEKKASDNEVLFDADCFNVGFAETDTKAFIDNDLLFCWNENDRVSVFNGSTVNQEYCFIGKDGDRNGILSAVSQPEVSQELSRNYAVYPYDRNIEITTKGDLSLSFPSVQCYAENSFGKNAAVFAAVTKEVSDKKLKFHCLSGFLRIQVYGGIVVKNIQIRGNRSEKLSGSCTVSLENIDAPEISFPDDAGKTITLDCGEGVATGEYPSQAVSFWVAIPPVVFSEGFTITVTDNDGRTTTHITNITREVVSNHIYSMKTMPHGLEDGPFITIDDDMMLVSYFGGDNEINVWSNVHVYSDIIDGDWITKSDKGSFGFVFAPNTSLLQRKGHIRFYDEGNSVSAILEVVQGSPASSFEVTFMNSTIKVPELSGNSPIGIIDWGDGSASQTYEPGAIHYYSDSQGSHTVKVTSMGSESFTLDEVEDGIIIDVSDFCRK